LIHWYLAPLLTPSFYFIVIQAQQLEIHYIYQKVRLSENPPTTTTTTTTTDTIDTTDRIYIFFARQYIWKKYLLAKTSHHDE